MGVVTNNCTISYLGGRKCLLFDFLLEIKIIETCNKIFKKYLNNNNL